MVSWLLTGNAYLIFPIDTVTYAWSQVSGPEDVVFDDPTANNVNVTSVGGSEGVYVIRLTVTDNNGNIATSDVSTTLQVC